MNTIEFKLKYPQYENLEWDALWDMMAEVMLQSSNCLTADPDREIIYHSPVKVNVLQNDGTYAEIKISMEDSSKTVWINPQGERLVLGYDPLGSNNSEIHTSYKFQIIDFSR